MSPAAVAAAYEQLFEEVARRWTPAGDDRAHTGGGRGWGPARRRYRLRRMGKASSAKKITRSTGRRQPAPGQRRNLAFPVLIMGIIVVGTVLGWVRPRGAPGHRRRRPDHGRPLVRRLRRRRRAASSRATSPTGKNTTGIDTPGDGLISIHPKGDGAGTNATSDKFSARSA